MSALKDRDAGEGKRRSASATGTVAERLLPVALLILVATVGCPGGTGNAGPLISTAEGSSTFEGAHAAVPEVTVVSTDKLAKVLASHRGKIVVVNFWATWCPPCVAEMPEFVKFYEEIQGADVLLLSVSADHPDTIDSHVKPFVARHGLPFPVRIIDERSPERLALALKIDWDGALPATFIFDQQGVLRKTWLEDVTFDDLTAAVIPLRVKPRGAQSAQ